MIELLVGLIIGFFVGVGTTTLILYLILRHPSFILSQLLKSPIAIKQLNEILAQISPEPEKEEEKCESS